MVATTLPLPMDVFTGTKEQAREAIFGSTIDAVRHSNHIPCHTVFGVRNSNTSEITESCPIAS